MSEMHEQAKQDYLAGMKYKDIAVKYNVSLPTVKSWKTRYKWDRKGMHTKKEKVCIQKQGGQPGNRNAVTHGLHSSLASLVIPEEDKELFDACESIGNLEYELKVARYKVNRLIREQEKQEMLGVMGGPEGIENFRLKDDFYEQAIQKGLDIVRKLEAQLQKEQFDRQKLEIERRKLLIIESKDKVPTNPSVKPYVDALKGTMSEVWDDETDK